MGGQYWVITDGQFSVDISKRTIRDCLSRIDKDSREARNKRIFDLWMACYTQEEIAEKENVTHQSVDLILQEMADLPKLAKSDKAMAEHAADFETADLQHLEAAGKDKRIEAPGKY
jgi:hypothetical protein